MAERGSRRNGKAVVTVTFMDGEVKTYAITASPTVAGYLAREAGQTGVLHLWSAEASWSIPLASIRDWVVKGATEDNDG